MALLLHSGGNKVKKFRLSILFSALLALGACSSDTGNSANHGSTDDGEAKNEYGTIDHGIDDKKVGFNVTGDTIEEAENVPAEEKEKIIIAFDKYIDTFNEKDIDAYMNTLSKHTESFDLEDERTYMTDIFSEYRLDRGASDVTITMYSETETHVFAKLETKLKELASEAEVTMNGRQVTVFTKDDGEWKITSIHYIGDDESQ